MERLDPELRQNIINNASEHLKREELNNLMWDELCAVVSLGKKAWKEIHGCVGRNII
jgi:hypothetical protein